MSELPEGAIRAYAAAVVPGCSVGRITKVWQFSGGENHHVYGVECLDAHDDRVPAVVRVARVNDETTAANEEAEARILRKIDGVAGPVLYDFSSSSTWFDAPSMCMEFVGDELRSPSSADEWQLLGDIIGRVHSFATDDLDDVTLYGTSLLEYLDARSRGILGKAALVTDPVPAEVHDRVRHLASRVADLIEVGRTDPSFLTPQCLVLLHGDAKGDNIAWNPRPVLIDWEYGRIGDPADEIAYTFAQCEASTQQREAFWLGYEAAAGLMQSTLALTMRRISWWEPLTLLGSAMYWNGHWTRRAGADLAGTPCSTSPKDQSYYARKTVEKLDQLHVLVG